MSRGAVTRAEFPEYGWYSVSRIIGPDILGESGIIHLPLPENLRVFQWHQDTFSLPPGSIHLYSSQFCKNQAFISRDRVIALQFHPELNPEAISAFINSLADHEHSSDMNPILEEIMKDMKNYIEGQDFIATLLTYLTNIARKMRNERN